MTKYIIKKASNQLVIEKRNTQGMKVIFKSAIPVMVEKAITVEATKMNKLGLKFQVENRTNILMNV